MKAPSRHAGGHADAHQAADAQHGGVEGGAQAELADVGAEDLGDPPAGFVAAR
jgi:hypothetical protein